MIRCDSMRAPVLEALDAREDAARGRALQRKKSGGETAPSGDCRWEATVVRYSASSVSRSSSWASRSRRGVGDVDGGQPQEAALDHRVQGPVDEHADARRARGVEHRGLAVRPVAGLEHGPRLVEVQGELEDLEVVVRLRRPRAPPRACARARSPPDRPPAAPRVRGDAVGADASGAHLLLEEGEGSGQAARRSRRGAGRACRSCARARP